MPLTETQIQHLKSRDDQPVAIRKNNEYAIRKHLEKFLEYGKDMAIVLDRLPEKQLKRYIKDDHVYMFLNFALRLMELLEFAPIKGEADDSDNWQVTIRKPNRKTKKSEPITRPANKIDINRSVKLNQYCIKIGRFVSGDDPAYLEYKHKIDELKPHYIDRTYSWELINEINRLASEQHEDTIEDR
jgi:hypothetical protein